MKVFRNSTTALMIAAVAVLATLGSGCGYIKKVIAKDKLNQGMIEYNKGNIRNAQEFFKDASETDPNNPTTWLCLGATRVKDYRKEIDNAKKKEVANDALKDYKNALSLANGNCGVIDNALSYMAVIYDDLRNDDRNDVRSVEEWRKVMEDRATNQCMKKDIQAQSFYGLGVDYWKCSYDQTTRYQDKALFATDQFHYRKMDYSPEALADRQKAQACVTKGFEYFEKALVIDPEYTQAMFYKGLLYRELQKLVKEEAKRKEFEQMALKIAAEANALQKKKEAAAAEQRAHNQAAPTS
jgi:tetratricopeptide (TPR) repeat protein